MTDNQVPFMKFELSQEYLDWLEEAIERADESAVKESLEEAEPADILTVLYELDTNESKFVLRLLDDERAADIIVEIEEEPQAKFLKTYEPREIARFIDYLDSDDGADILNRLPIQTREEVIALLEDEETARNVKELIRYEEDRAGGLMAKEFIKAKASWSIVQCIEEIRRQAEKVEKIFSVYVVDEQNRLLGRVSLKRIILASDNTKIGDIYDEEVISVPTHMEEEEIAGIMKKYDLEAVPVVDVRGRLVGRITIDDIVDVITEMADEERQMMAGISADVEERSGSVWMLSRARLPWLIIGMMGGMLGAYFIGFFEQDIALVPALAFFIPLITATGGNVGIQSSSIVVQSLANPSVFEDSLGKRLLKVLTVALVNGSALALLVLGISAVFGQGMNMAIVVAVALFSVVLLASFMGTITPILLDKLGTNPALASGPFITTANDLLGLAVYFAVAHAIHGSL